MRSILFSMFLLGTLSASAQMGVRFFTEIPLKGHPEFLGNSYGVELLGFIPIDQDERFSARLGVGFLNRTFKFEEIPDYAILIDRNTATAYEGFTRWEYYQESIISLGANCNVINAKAFKAYVGADFLIGMFLYKYRSEIENVSNADVVENGITLGYRLRAGISYQPFESVQFFAETHWGKRKQAGMDAWTSADIGAGIIYYFNQ